ncbi:MFS transporter [Solirubrobacter phytolaccae]|uniref:MFS transporter n=1 Tax=Solirubrobacter phytolaccae TaxID=1404360 RepID=A0A9X3NE67_9ACTN|nr:MFS transporter [Solirubrobacter phytolaccae]MDA0184514.1 MFS transporter [Solirubrobacter phytolaccae]
MESGATREQWRKTGLAAMANYIDAGSIVAGAVSLPLWAEQFGFGDDFVSLLGAMSSNAISAGIGALIGGRICDLYGRKKIYQYDLLLYAFGALWIVFAQAPWMLLFGYFIVGLTVGADVPASWTLITETAPKAIRGRLAGLAQVLWYVGAIAPLVLGIALLDLGEWLPRILFAQLFVVAMITWALRQGMVESELWAKAQEQAQGATGAFRELFRKRYVRALSFLILMYGVWNLVAGTYGFFFPYILDAVGDTGDRANYALQAIWFLSTALAVGTIYMPLIDRVGGRRLLVWATLLQVAGFIPFVFFDVSFLTALINVVLFGIGAGIGQQSLFQLWSGELFPTLLRSSAQGFMFGVVRVALGGWSLLLPTVQEAGFRTLAIVLALMLIVSGVIGILFAPDRAARELHD